MYTQTKCFTKFLNNSADYKNNVKDSNLECIELAEMNENKGTRLLKNGNLFI